MQYNVLYVYRNYKGEKCKAFRIVEADNENKAIEKIRESVYKNTGSNCVLAYTMEPAYYNDPNQPFRMMAKLGLDK